MIATDMNSHNRILSRSLEILAHLSRQRETRSADFSTKRVLITLEEELLTGYAPVVAVGVGSFGAVAPPIPPPFGPR